MFESSPLLIDQFLALGACDGYIVLVVDPDTREVDAHGPYDGLSATNLADGLRTEFDLDELADVQVTVVRLHHPQIETGAPR
jgi:hypothetical protein